MGGEGVVYNPLHGKGHAGRFGDGRIEEVRVKSVDGGKGGRTKNRSAGEGVVDDSFHREGDTGRFRNTRVEQVRMEPKNSRRGSLEQKNG